MNVRKMAPLRDAIAEVYTPGQGSQVAISPIGKPSQQASDPPDGDTDAKRNDKTGLRFDSESR